jgi:hypothetical protein
MQEIDFNHEIKNMVRLYDLAVGSRFQKISRPFPDFSTPKVVATGHLRGLPVSELLLTVPRGVRATKKMLRYWGRPRPACRKPYLEQPGTDFSVPILSRGPAPG